MISPTQRFEIGSPCCVGLVVNQQTSWRLFVRNETFERWAKAKSTAHEASSNFPTFWTHLLNFCEKIRPRIFNLALSPTFSISFAAIHVSSLTILSFFPEIILVSIYYSSFQNHLWSRHQVSVSCYEAHYEKPQNLEKLVRCKVCFRALKPEQLLQHASEDHELSLGNYFRFVIDSVSLILV